MKYFLYCRKSTEAEDRQVMSLDSQRAELARSFGDRSEIEIVETLIEARSAKAPGREVFGDMLRRIEKGEAEGIMAWAPDRLARNSIDGGHIVYLLDRGVLRDLKFANYTFENNSQGKFMLNIMFGYSKYYSDNLSEVVKRGNRAKLERGWRPNAAPTGYLNDPITKTIVVDPARFPLVERLFALVAQGGHTVESAARVAREEWGFKTYATRRGGGLIGVSSVHRILTSRFYLGEIDWDGQRYPGSHTPAVSPETFDAVQAHLGRGHRERPKRQTFAYSGFIRCGACGRGVTAEHKVNRHGHRYLYYHCNRRRAFERCKEPSIEVRDLERQAQTFLRTIELEAGVAAVIQRGLKATDETVRLAQSKQQQALEDARREIEQQKAEARRMRVARLLSDDEYRSERARLEAEERDLEARRAAAQKAPWSLEPAETVISFSKYAATAFSGLREAEKREVLNLAVSNPTLKDGIVSFQAAKPFVTLDKIRTHLCQLGDWDDVPTPCVPSELVTEFVRASCEMETEHPALFERVRVIINSNEVLTS